MPVVKSKKSGSLTHGHGLRSRLTASLMGRNSENCLPGLDSKPHLRLLEVTNHAESSRILPSKRKTKHSSPQGPLVKRTAFSDVTNAIQKLQFHHKNSSLDKAEKGKNLLTGRTVLKTSQKQQPASVPEEGTEEENATLYMSALEEVPENSLQTQSQPTPDEAKLTDAERESKQRSSSEPPVSIAPVKQLSSKSEEAESEVVTYTELVSATAVSPSVDDSFVTALSPLHSWQLQSPESPPAGVPNFDREIAQDSNDVADYAPFIFCYLRSREPHYKVKSDFLSQHALLNHDLRAMCVDWMVEVQETLELNHETLYLGVKNMDLFLSNPLANSQNYKTPTLPVRPSKLRLIACASLLLAAQYDERMPPAAEDWIQMCDNDFTVAELSSMQQQLFCSLGFDLGAPLSYRFLRRYARACSIDMDLLTLGRYILESALLGSQFSPESDSKLAAAGLWLAMCMHSRTETREQRVALWTPALEHYAGYKVQELIDLTGKLNRWLSSLPTKYLTTVHSKYSHKIFRKVALVPTLNQV